MKHFALIVAVALVPALSGCVEPTTKTLTFSDAEVAEEVKRQRDFAYRAWLEDEERLHAVGWRVGTAAVPLCARTREATGFTFGTLAGMPASHGEPARRLDGFSQGLHVMLVAKGSPADEAGLRRGDRLLSVNGSDVTGASAEAAIQPFESASPELVVRVQRSGEVLERRMRTRTACNLPPKIKESDEANAYADGRNIVVTSAMMRFARSDDELAQVFAHELAHNTMGHLDAKDQNALAAGLLGGIVDLFAAFNGINTQGSFFRQAGEIGRQAYSVDFETEADYVGLYMVALAGYDMSKAPDFWRRMGVNSPGHVDRATTHPSYAQRSLHLTRTAEEIERKRSAGLPLVPDKK